MKTQASHGKFKRYWLKDAVINIFDDRLIIQYNIPNSKKVKIINAITDIEFVNLCLPVNRYILSDEDGNLIINYDDRILEIEPEDDDFKKIAYFKDKFFTLVKINKGAMTFPLITHKELAFDFFSDLLTTFFYRFKQDYDEYILKSIEDGETFIDILDEEKVFAERPFLGIM